MHETCRLDKDPEPWTECFLADVFFKAGKIEAWGRGTIKIVDECKKAGLPEPEFREEFGGLSVFFRKGKSGDRVVESGEKAG